MKRILLLAIIAISFSSCSIERERVVNMFYLDYRQFTKQGFYISKDPYFGECTVLGEIEIDLLPAIKRHTVYVNDSEEKISVREYEYKKREGYTYTMAEDLSLEDLTQIVMDEVVKLGGNGIVNYSIQRRFEEKKSKLGGDYWWIIEGTVIRIDGKEGDVTPNPEVKRGATKENLSELNLQP